MDDLDRLTAHARALGATEEEIEAALATDRLGPLALDLAMRPDGTTVSVEEFVAGEADPALARRVWRALGFPDADDPLFRVTPDIAEAVRIVAFFVGTLGEREVLGVARVIGSSAARMADALSSASRMGVEVPQLEGGRPYEEVVEEYSILARELLPVFWNAVGATFRRHMVLVSHARWSPDEDRVAVMLERTVGFVDLVGSTEVLRRSTVREMAELVERFEQLTWDVVTGAGGRVVKLIGDEAMFALPDPAAAVAVARRLVEASPEPVRIGLAHGPVAAFRGDYYGPTVNLAARLVAVAPTGGILVNQPVDGVDCQPYDTGPLRGFPDPIEIWSAAAP